MVAWLKHRRQGHNPLAIANRFIEKAVKAGRPLSIIHLLRLVYLAHGWCLGYTGKPLLSTKVQVWRNGPMIPEIYDEFRAQGIDDISMVAVDEEGDVLQADLTEQEADIVDRVYDNYAPLSTKQLASLTRADGTPWSRTKGYYYDPIPDKLIGEYYAKRVRESEEASAHG